MNVGQVNYYTSQIVFLDLVKQAQDWGLGSGGWEVPVDAHGWPTFVPIGKRVGFIARAPRAGRYVARWEGDGEIAVAHGGRIVRASARRAELELEGGEAHFYLIRSERGQPLRRLSIVPAEREADHEKVLFDPEFLALAPPFGVLRFMDWLRINGSTQRRWEDRASPEHFSQCTERGASLEYALELCNRVKADCWINLPAMVDDDYVARAAEVVRDRLDPALKAYVEYSNEIWNFPHGDWCQAEGERLGMPRGWDARLRYQARRSKEIFRIFERILGPRRLVRVLAGQTWDARLQLLAEWEDAGRSADVLAIAPYFCDDLEQVAGGRATTPRALAERCAADVERIRERVRRSRAVAERFKLPLVGYEGGQHLVTGGALHADAALQRVLDGANRDPAMGIAYRRFLEMWREEKGGVLLLYTLIGEPSKWGRWGLVERLGPPPEDSPKYRAALEFLDRVVR